MNIKAPVHVQHLFQDAYDSFLLPHGEILDSAAAELDKSRVRPDVKKLLGYRMELNFRLSAWDRLETETNLFVLTGILLGWLEHLKSPILDQVPTRPSR